MIMKKRTKLKLSTTHVILLGFLLTVLIGSLLLYLPISVKDGVSVSYIDALFTATTSTCVTGLVTVVTADTWSVFGQVVILLLIQIGGLGVITVMSAFMLLLHRRMGLNDIILIQDSLNLNTMSGLASFIKKVVMGTFIVEGVGALLYMTVFVPEFGIRGVWISVFNSVSAFCNAGIDIISADSLMAYALNPIVNIVTSLLIIIGGIGYVVWWDVIRISKEFKKSGLKSLQKLTLHSKIAIITSLILIFAGGILIFIFEYNNPLTIGNLSLFDKLQVSFFQSVTTRTAGFATVSQNHLTDATSILCLLLMFIGGSPVGTAGGIKTVTFTVLILAVVSTIRNKNETVAFHRNISKDAIGKSLAVTGMAFSIVFISTLLLSLCTSAPFLDILYETVSATATVGLTRNLTPLLNTFGKIIIIFTMYLGRVGPISLAIAFNVKTSVPNIIKNPTESISVG
ncbi:MAG: potassium transporter KtrB [Clostridia bacterium]|nr:potassium transporter KtrB [Clostridia bacterium]